MSRDILMFLAVISLRSKRSCTKRTKFGPREGVFCMRAARKNGARVAMQLSSLMCKLPLTQHVQVCANVRHSAAWHRFLFSY